eukprot:1155152-Pelagomonas_calceolata.AAC.7
MGNEMAFPPTGCLKTCKAGCASCIPPPCLFAGVKGAESEELRLAFLCLACLQASEVSEMLRLAFLHLAYLQVSEMLSHMPADMAVEATVAKVQ